MTSPRHSGGAVWPWVGLAVRLGLAAVFGISGTLKALDPRGTLVAVRAYELLGDAEVRLLAGVLPYLELALAVLLIAGMATRWVAVASALLLLIFIAGVISAAARGLTIDCGCFGGGGVVQAEHTAYTAEILRDVGFLALAGYLIVRPLTALSVDAWALRRAAAPAGGPPGGAGIDDGRA